MSRVYVPKYGQPIEHAIVRALVVQLSTRGWLPVRASDGEEVHRVRSVRQVLDVVFSVDESAVAFSNGTVSHDVVFICGNGEDIVSDWRFSDADDFGAAMDAITDAISAAPLAVLLP